MSLGERIKEKRLSSGLSQEKVAELVGVSRQAVTKWESNQSSPSTENLFRLAEILGTSVDMLFTADDESKKSVAEEMYHLFKLDEEAKAAARRNKTKKNMKAVSIIFIAYVILYLFCRLIWYVRADANLMSFLWGGTPEGEHSYLIEWMLHNDLYLYSMLISIVPAFFGKIKYSFISYIGFLLGFIAGVLFGHYPDGIEYGQSEYGWAIWICTFIASIIIGAVAEIMDKKAKNKRGKNF